MEILETKGRKMNKIKREEREDLHTFSDTTNIFNLYGITTWYKTNIYVLHFESKKIIGEFFNKKKIIRNYKIFFFNYFFAEY